MTIKMCMCDSIYYLSNISIIHIMPRFPGQVFFDKVGLSQKNMLVSIQLCGEVSLSNICDKGERAKYVRVAKTKALISFAVTII